MKPSPTEDAIKAIHAIIRIATPRASYRGKQDRNKLVKQVICATKALSYDKRVNP
jgi:hypothetical protein